MYFLFQTQIMGSNSRKPAAKTLTLVSALPVAYPAAAAAALGVHHPAPP
jgi:hypothetical protein